MVDPDTAFRMRRLWRHQHDVIVTWHHRWRHQSTRHRHFLMGSLLDTTIS